MYYKIKKVSCSCWFHNAQVHSITFRNLQVLKGLFFSNNLFLQMEMVDVKEEEEYFRILGVFYI